jgi:hypothetical protein
LHRQKHPLSLRFHWQLHFEEEQAHQQLWGSGHWDLWGERERAGRLRNAKRGLGGRWSEVGQQKVEVGSWLQGVQAKKIGEVGVQGVDS